MHLASWSGGKDSCLASYLAIKKGMKITHLVHFDRPNNLHGVDPAMIRIQAELAEMPMVQRRVASEDFEREFKKTVGDLARNGAQGMIFGDIYLEPHKEWVGRTCGELGIEPLEPLWGCRTEDIIRSFFNLGFETIVASGDQKLIDKKFIGRKMDDEFIEYLKYRNLDVCGENGEFHTFVTAGPLFKGRIEITDSAVTSRDGFWFLDVRDYN
ncbi:MAG: diphthine--ammonia ligase, partial [Betaproteobacteria bacterium]